MNHETGRLEIRNIIGTHIVFDGHFDKCFDNLKESQKKELINWIISCSENTENPIQSKNNRELIGFVKRIGSNLRAILTKEKKGYYIKLFLDKHKYYETEMESLGF